MSTNNLDCTFYNKSFFENLYSHNIVSIDNNNDKFEIHFDINGTISKIPIEYKKPSLLLGTFNNEYWTPIFINLNNSIISNNYLASGFVLSSENLGIESIIKFNPKLKDWTITDGAKMVTDWILTSPLYPYLPEYGLLCWAKTKTYSADANGITIDKIPYNTVVYSTMNRTYTIDKQTVSITTSTKLLKKTDDVLLIIDNDIVKKNTDGEIRPTTSNKYFILSELIKFSKNSINKNNILFLTNPNRNSNNNTIYHISHGEAYSYYESDNVKTISLKDGIPSQTYISPVLHDIYRQIYHNLTFKLKKEFDNKIPKPIFNRVYGRKFKKICYFLATHPQVDRTTVSILQHPDIYQIINNYINSPEDTSDPSKNETNTRQVLIDISKYFKDLNIDEVIYQDPAYIPKKLIQKYGAKLQFEGPNNYTLTYKDNLPNGPHLKVSSDIRSLSSRDISNGTLSDNITVTVGPFAAKTILDSEQSVLEISSTLDDKKTIVPLWDIQKTRVIDQGAPFTAGPDIEVKFNDASHTQSKFFIARKESINELAIDLKVGLNFDLEDSALAGVNVEFNWKRISGPDCLRFSNKNLTNFNSGIIAGGESASLRFETSDDESPTIYIKKSGKYIIQFTIRTPFGVKSQTVNIYITDDNYSRPRNEIPRNERVEDLLPLSKNVVMVHGLKEFVFGKQGIFWPIYSDLSVYEPKYTSARSQLPGLDKKTRVGNAVKPLGSILNKFLIEFDRESTKAKKLMDSDREDKLSFNINPSSNVISEINRIKLSNINSETNPHCESIYRETFDNSLTDLELDQSKIAIDPITEKEFEVKRPNKIGTTSIQLFSNEEPKLKDAMFGNTVENLFFNSFDYDSDIYGPDVSGFSNAANPVICYETYSKNEELNKLLTIPMQKGFFHPNSGWVSQETIRDNVNFNNRTSIIIGDGLKRNCKTFKGLGFDAINNNFTDGNVKIYKSSITLRTEKIAHDFFEIKEIANPNISMNEKLADHDKQEANDHMPNHGYRDLSGRVTSLYKYNDEFVVAPSTRPDGLVGSYDYCNDAVDIDSDRTSIVYGYPKPGPIFVKPTGIRSDSNNPSGIRFDRDFGRKIGDLEIKLNYLNYINPKELVIWLTIDGPEDVIRSMTRVEDPGPADPFYFSKNRDEYLNEITSISNSGIQKFALDLFNLNDNPFKQEEAQRPAQQQEGGGVGGQNRTPLRSSLNYYLYLLNQDHIDISLYNNILKFTDNTFTNNSNINANEFITADTTQARLKNGIIEINPTLSPSGYSDEEISKYKTIINSNQLSSYIPAKFSKFKNMPLFQQYEDPRDPKARNSSSITFTLNIAVIGESDDSSIYDRVLSTDNIININSVKTKSISSILTNSLCSWEIILHNDKSLLNYEDKDVFGQIDYRSETPRYEGYNFIAKIPSGIIPPINRDAPNKSIYDLTKCFYSRESITSPRIYPTPQLSVNPIAYLPSFSLVGEIASAVGIVGQVNLQAASFFNFFNDLRRINLSEEFNREIYIPRYTDFPTGRSDKALVSISKDNIVWFKLEAGILRYNNCPIFKKKKYVYRHVHYLNEFKNLCKFTLNNINDISILINYKTKTIKPIVSQVSGYSLTIDDIKANTKELLDTVKTKIYELHNNIKSLTESQNPAQNPDQNRLSNLQQTLSEYKTLFGIIGPEGIKQDNIIKFETTTTDQESGVQTTTISYNLVKDDDSLLEFTDLYTLLEHNKSLFIDNNLTRIHESLENYPLTLTIVSNVASQVPETSSIVSIKGIRAYSVYKNDESVEIFTAKQLSESDNNQINTINKTISEKKQRLSDAISKQPQNQENISRLSKEILDLENTIFLIKHDKTENKIINKGIIRNKKSYSTIIALENPVKDKSILVIKPSDNRIIACDNDYFAIEDNKEIFNPWSFVNQTELINDKIAKPLTNIYNAGMYGSGSISNNSLILYDPEIINYVKDFIEYLYGNMDKDDTFKDDCIIYNDNVKYSALINKIFTFGSIDTSMLTKKYDSYIKMKPKNTNTFQFQDILNIFNNILTYEKYNVFFKEEALKFLVEGSLNIDLSTLPQNSGTIEFSNHATTSIVYSAENLDQYDQILERVASSGIPVNITNKQNLIKSKLSEISSISNENNTSRRTEIEEEIKSLKQDIAKLHLEYNKLSYYVENFNNNNPENKILGNIVLSTKTNEDGSLSIKEEANDDLYILNIDAEQGCSLDTDKLPKILVQIEYECFNVLSPFYVDPFRFCPGVKGGVPQTKFGDYTIDIEQTKTTYTLSENKIEELKTKNDHPDLVWGRRRGSSTRTFFLNGQDNRGGIVKATYIYIIPNYVPNPPINSNGELINKVKYLFNLNTTDEIFIDFRKINRNLRNIDPVYHKYVPTVDGLLVKSSSLFPGGPIDNTLKVWECYGIQNGSKLPLPINFKWMNFVKYMTFYNQYLITNKAIDEPMFDLNQGLDSIKVRDEMGLIPYDYK
jgi:hypothetical protein